MPGLGSEHLSAATSFRPPSQAFPAIIRHTVVPEHQIGRYIGLEGGWHCEKSNEYEFVPCISFIANLNWYSDYLNFRALTPHGCCFNSSDSNTADWGYSSVLMAES